MALAACRAGATLVVTKLERLARSLPDARDIHHELTKRHIKFSLGGSIHAPTDPLASYRTVVTRMCCRGGHVRR